MPLKKDMEKIKREAIDYTKKKLVNETIGESLWK